MPGLDADVIYTFWVKHAICTDPNCGREVPLFKDYFIGHDYDAFWRERFDDLRTLLKEIDP